MRKLRNIAAGVGIAGAIGVAALGIGAGTANAAPPSPALHAGFAEWGHGWGPRPWIPGPPPPPAYGYDYGGWNNYGPPPPPCLSGPLGFVQVCA